MRQVKVCPKCGGALSTLRKGIGRMERSFWVLSCVRCYKTFGCYANKAAAEKEKKYDKNL